MSRKNIILIFTVIFIGTIVGAQSSVYDWYVDNDLVVGSEITIGASVVNETELGYLDGQDQAVATTDNVGFVDLTTTGKITVRDGSSAALSIGPTSSSNTGFYWISGSQLDYRQSGNQAFVVDASRNFRSQGRFRMEGDTTGFKLLNTDTNGYFNTAGIGVDGSDNMTDVTSLAIGSSSVDASSLLDVTSTAKGTRPYPSMTTVQRDAISTPATGLIIYNTTTNELNYYNSVSWDAIATGTSSNPAAGLTSGSVTFSDGANGLSEDTTNFVWDNTNKRLGLGDNTPDEQLHLKSASPKIKFQDTDDATGAASFIDADNSTGTFSIRADNGSLAANSAINLIVDDVTEAYINSGGMNVDSDFTVDSTTLHVDSTNNRVGLLDTSPSYTFDMGTNTAQIGNAVWDYDGGTTRSRITAASGVALALGAGGTASHVLISTGGDLGIAKVPSIRLDVSGDGAVSGSFSKGSGTFRIDHPEDPDNQWLFHQFYESPEALLAYRGQADTESKLIFNNNRGWFYTAEPVEDGAGGELRVRVTLPTWFDDLTSTGKNDNEYTVQVTGIGGFCGDSYADFSEIHYNSIIIAVEKPCKFSWMLQAVRHDAFYDKNPMQVEKLKSEVDIGKKIHEKSFEGWEQEKQKRLSDKPTLEDRPMPKVRQ